MIDFALSDEQEMLRKAARGFLEEHCPPAVVREWEAAGAGAPRDLWSAMAAMGWVGLALPGGGGSLLDLAVVFEELGRAVCPSPLFSTVLAGLTLADAGHLPDGLAGGGVVAGTALVDVPADALDTRVEGDRAVVTGTVPFAYDCADADVLLVAAGPVLVLLDGAAPGVEVRPLQGISHDRLCELTFDGATGEVVGDVATLLPAALARATALRCCEVVGVMSRALEMTADYVRERVQFQRPLGSFQAVQHRLADMLLDVEGARWTAYRAAWALAGGESDPAAGARAAAVAKAWTSDACQRVAFGAQQLHGGIGVDLDYDLHLYFRRAKALELELGPAPVHRARLADMMGLT